MILMTNLFESMSHIYKGRDGCGIKIITYFHIKITQKGVCQRREKINQKRSDQIVWPSTTRNEKQGDDNSLIVIIIIITTVTHLNLYVSDFERMLNIIAF